MIEVGREGIVLYGFSVALLGALRDQLPDGSVLVIEEPDVAAGRHIPDLVGDYPAVSRVIYAAYQLPDRLERLLAEEPAIGRARAVLPGSEYAVVAAAVTAERVGALGAGVAAARTFRDKFELREVTSRAGVRNPAYALVETVTDAEAFFLAGGMRACVLKPTARQASVGVQIVTELAQLRAGWSISAEPDEGYRAPARGVPSRTLVEHALEGAEYSVEQLVAGGRAVFANITAKQVHAGRFPVELGHVVPAPVSDSVRDELLAAQARLVAATGFGHGILHSEWIVTAGGPALVECAARIPGDEIGTLISDAWAFSLPEAYVRLMLGEPVRVPAAPTGGAAIAFLTAAPGTVSVVEGVESVRALAGVRDAKVTVAAGTVVEPVTSSWDRVGFVRVGAGSPEQARALATRAAAAITVRTAEPQPAAVR